MSYPDASETLTFDELCADAGGHPERHKESPFQIADPLDVVLPKRTRNPIVFEGERWVEIDIKTGEIVDAGCAIVTPGAGGRP